jgi:DNA invertase Pin-like site-specific DNA recombinase
MSDELVKVCAYCRVSTDSKDQENSFENQQTYLYL